VVVGRPTEWGINIEGDLVEVWRHGAWFSDAYDLDDAIGILGGQRASEYTLNDNGRVETRRL